MTTIKWILLIVFFPVWFPLLIVGGGLVIALGFYLSMWAIALMGMTLIVLTDILIKLL